MNRPFSIYLDLVRITAALLVFLTHAARPFSGALKLGGLDHFGHDAVVVFFVLSGLVIAYTAEQREHDPKSYMLSRLARLWSVLVPALIVAVVEDTIGMRIAPDHYIYGTANDIAAFLTGIFFVNQLWTIDYGPVSNWSVGFEFWYYLVFALWLFVPGRRRYVAVAIACAIMGPKILVLLPIWLMGVAVYRYRPPDKPILGLALAIGSLAFYIAYRLSNLSDHFRMSDPRWFLTRHLGLANYFPSDTIVGAIFAVHFLGFKMASAHLERFIVPFEKPIRLAAACTFSVYLFHVHLLEFLGTLIPDGNYVVIPIALAVIAAIARVTEQKKHVVRRWLEHLYSALFPRSVIAPASGLELRRADP